MTAQPDLIVRLRETTTPNVRLYREAADALECALADLDAAKEALKDGAIVIEKMANGASRRGVSPWYDNFRDVLARLEGNQP